MARINLNNPYAVVDFVKVIDVKVDSIHARVFASVFFCSMINGTELSVIPLKYSTQNFGRISPIGTVVLVGDDYVAYNDYVNQGKTSEEAVLQVLLDRNVVSGTLV